MKKLLFVVMVLGALATHAQNYFPLLPRCNYKPGTPEYRQYFFGEIQKDPDYRATLLLFVNTALKDAGEDKNLNNGKPLEHKHVWWITGQIYFDSVHLGRNEIFTNTRKLKNGKTEQYEDSIQKNFIAGTFKYKACNFTFLKADCFNFIDLHEAPIQQVNPEENFTVIPTPKPVSNIRVVERVYDTVYFERKKIEDERARVAAETHAQNRTQSQSFDYSHSNTNEIEVLEVEEGAQFSIGLSGGGYSYNGQSQGPFGGSCTTSSGGQGGLALGYQAPSSTRYYRNSSASSSNTSTSSSYNQGGNGNNNQNYQNQNRQQSGGMRQPIYGPDPNSFVGTAKTGF